MCVYMSCRNVHVTPADCCYRPLLRILTSVLTALHCISCPCTCSGGYRPYMLWLFSDMIVCGYRRQLVTSPTATASTNSNKTAFVFASNNTTSNMPSKESLLSPHRYKVHTALKLHECCLQEDKGGGDDLCCLALEAAHLPENLMLWTR